MKKSFKLVYLATYLMSSIRSFSLSRTFVHTPKHPSHPQLILIGGSTGTGKSTFGMTIALNQGIYKCISTDSIREVMRGFDKSPALQRSSYSGEGDPVLQWKECCEVLDLGVERLVEDAMRRGQSIVIEGVHLVPENKLINKWLNGGFNGTAIGCMLKISDPEAHYDLLSRRGWITKKGAEQQLKSFQRIRAIQEEMSKLATQNNWITIEQKLEPEPVELIELLLQEQEKKKGSYRGDRE